LFLFRGQSYFNEGKYDLAIADYDQAIRLDPKDADYYNDRGLAYYAKGDYDRAIADFQQVLRINPADSDTKKLVEALLQEKQKASTKPALPNEAR
jgi:tetratricopeptide (TPR) repeat protein